MLLVWKLRYIEVDLLCRGDDGQVVTVEIQNINHPYFLERSLQYAFHAYEKNFAKKELMRGSESNYYSALRTTHSINIHNFMLFEPEEGALQTFGIFNVKSFKPINAYEKLGVIYFNYLNLKKKAIDPKIQDWIDFFKGAPLRREVAPYIKQAEDIVINQSLTKEEKDMIEAISKAEAIRLAKLGGAIDKGFDLGEESGIAKGIVKGREEGIVEGEMKANRKMVLRMHHNGNSAEKISDTLGFDLIFVRKVIDSE